MLNRSTAAAQVAKPDILDNIALVIFDCDGVLIDSEPIASSTLADSLRGAGIDITPAQSHAKFTGNSIRVIRQMIIDDYAVADVDALLAAWNAVLFDTFARRLTAMPGIVDVVGRLSRPKCVASNSTLLRLERSLGLLELWGHFEGHVYSAEAVARPKPAPDLMLHCARSFDVDPVRCVMIDDSPHGIEAAVAAGMVPIGFVDPADSRPDRAAVLFASGAAAVATGAAELPAALSLANERLN